jgi:hypothetical protein
MHYIIQEVVVVEVKLRFRNEIYDFYLTGVLLLPPNFNTNHLLRAAHFVITQNTPPQMSVEYANVIATIQCSQDYYDASFKTYHWHLLPSHDGFASTLNPEKIPYYYITTFYIKGLPEYKAPIKPYILNSNFKLAETF